MIYGNAELRSNRKSRKIFEPDYMRTLNMLRSQRARMKRLLPNLKRSGVAEVSSQLSGEYSTNQSIAVKWLRGRIRSLLNRVSGINWSGYGSYAKGEAIRKTLNDLAYNISDNDLDQFADQINNELNKIVNQIDQIDTGRESQIIRAYSTSGRSNQSPATISGEAARPAASGKKQKNSKQLVKKKTTVTNTTDWTSYLPWLVIAGTVGLVVFSGHKSITSKRAKK